MKQENMDDITLAAKLWPGRGWTVDAERNEHSDPPTITVRFSPPLREDDGTVWLSREGCVVVPQDRRLMSEWAPCCNCTMTIEMEGFWRSTACCKKHGIRVMTWKETYDVAVRLWLGGEIEEPVLNKMINARFAARNGRDEETMERIERWMHECD